MEVSGEPTNFITLFLRLSRWIYAALVRGGILAALARGVQLWQGGIHLLRFAHSALVAVDLRCACSRGYLAALVAPLGLGDGGGRGP